MKRGAGVFLWFACLYVLSLGRGFYTSDGEVMFKTTAALVDRHTFALEPDPGLPQIVPGQRERFYSKYDPGLPLLGVPFYVTGDWIGQINEAHRYRLAAFFYLLIPALSAAGAITLLYWLAQQLYGERRALIVALMAGLGTLIWPYARVLFPEAVLACALTGSVALAVSFTVQPRLHSRYNIERGRLFAAGLVFGLGVMIRAAFAIYALPIAYLIVSTTGSRREKVLRLVAFGVGMIPGVVIVLWHNAQRFGDPFQFGYGSEGFTTPIWEGVIGLLFSPGKSVFLYTPPLMLSVILGPRFYRAFPVLGRFLMLSWAAAVVFYGTWWAWHGAWCWGPRFLVPLIPLSCLPLGKLPDSRRWRIVAAALIVLGIGVQGLGVLTDVVPWYVEVVGADPARYTQINFVPRYSSLVGAVHRLVAGQSEPLAVFHLNDMGLPLTWTIGVPLLLVIGVISGAGWFAHKRQI